MKNCKVGMGGKNGLKAVMRAAMCLLLIAMMVVSCWSPASVTAASKVVKNKALGYMIGGECEVNVNTDYEFDATIIPDEALFLMFKFTVKKAGNLTIHYTDDNKAYGEARFMLGYFSNDQTGYNCWDEGDFDFVDKGTYYIWFGIFDGLPFDKFNLRIDLETVGGDGEDGKAMGTAFTLAEGKKNSWVCTTEGYWSRIDLKEDSVVRLYCEAETYTNVRVYDGLGNNITCEALGWEGAITNYIFLERNKGESMEMTLKKGTYYFAFDNRAYKKKVTMKYEILKETDVTPPNKVTSVKYTVGGKEITCKGEAGATVWAVVSDQVYRASVGTDKKCTVKLDSKLKEGDVIYIWQVDKAGNQCNYRKVKVKSK